jgi:hypothetical protein
MEPSKEVRNSFFVKTSFHFRLKSTSGDQFIFGGNWMTLTWNAAWYIYREFLYASVPLNFFPFDSFFQLLVGCRRKKVKLHLSLFVEKHRQSHNVILRPLSPFLHPSSFLANIFTPFHSIAVTRFNLFFWCRTQTCYTKLCFLKNI